LRVIDRDEHGPEEEQQERREDAESERQSPDEPQVVHAGDPEDHERDKGRDDEAEVDHRVGRERKVHLLAVLLDALGFGVLTASDRPGRVLGANADADKERLQRTRSAESDREKAFRQRLSETHPRRKR
jgi:hypothetical protein